MAAAAGPPPEDRQAAPVASAGGPVVQPGTLPRAAILGGAMLAVLAVIAAFGFSGDTPLPADRYLRLGPERAAAALKRDLLAEFAMGTPVAPLLHRLGSLGMRCTPVAAPPGEWHCAVTVRLEQRRSLQLRAVIGTSGDMLAGLETATSINRP